MKKFASVIIAVIMLVLCLALSACGNKYISHYSATLMVKSNTSNKASVSFDSFNGTYVMQLRTNGADKVFITYEASLGEGNLNVYYDYNDEKISLFELKANDSIAQKTEIFTDSKTIYIIIESHGICNNGSFSFVLNKI